jgi:hypothetical protein
MCERSTNQPAAAHAYLAHADHLMITLGSAWLYTLTEKAANAIAGSVAANNHKAPATWFQKRLLNAGEEHLICWIMMLSKVVCL